jgi:hypothetical protein
MFDFARTMLVHSERIQGPTVERITAMILIAIYLENEGIVNEYYGTIGMSNMRPSLSRLKRCFPRLRYPNCSIQ